MTEGPVGAVLVIGGGIAGMQASLDLADSGFKVYLVDRSPNIGGAMAQLDKTFPTNDCAMCIMAPKLVETGRHHNIQIISNAEVELVEGSPGNFRVTVRKRTRRVREDKCTGCGVCTQRCPVEVPDEYNKGLKLRKAIYVKYPQAIPPTHIIDEEHCIGCGICATQCEAEAIEYFEKEKILEMRVGSIILAPGYEEFNLSLKPEYGYGRYPNVVSSLDLERMLSATGPYGGLVLRPSDGEIPGKIAFIQCIGSRDTQIGKTYCSSVCCMFAIKEAIIAQEHTPGLKPTIFFMDIRAYGKEFDEYYIRAEEVHNIKFVKNNRIAKVEEDPTTKNLIVWYLEGEELKSGEFNMVVLSVGTSPPKDVERIKRVFGVDLNKHGFAKTSIFAPMDTNVPGIYVCGAFSAPKDIPDSVAQASGAAAKASSLISAARGTLVTEREFPPETDVVGQEPRIGVFVCHCGINIGGVVRVPEVAQYARGLPDVVYAEENLYTCSQDTNEKIKQKIKEHNLNRVIVASCTPRTHAPLFQNTIRQAGLNVHLFEMANIRDQCSWVHTHEPDKATQKAKDLVRMAVAKARLLEQLPRITVPVKKCALILGGGMSGMTCAIQLADEGYETHIVEKEKELGGILKRIHYTLNGEDTQRELKEMIKRVEGNEMIHVHTNALLKGLSGYVGSYVATVSADGKEEKIDTGVIIVATGGVEYKPMEYLYGKHSGVMTQLEFEELIAKDPRVAQRAKSVVMIQCVGCRTKERVYCSRVCCTETIKNALKLKEANPAANVYVLHKDIRTYGFREDFFSEAAEKGVMFIRYDDDSLPAATIEKGKLQVQAFEHFLGEHILLRPDMLVLAAATLPNPDNEALAKILKVPLSKDRFFLEAHMKLRPVDFATDGIYLCGLAHSPKFLEECIAQASAAVSRASTILSKDSYETEGIVSQVNEEKCTGCGTCLTVCPYGAMEKTAEGVAKTNIVLCKGCGTCVASCPERAIRLPGFTDEQLIAQVANAVKEVNGVKGGT
ncbi:MAG: heterodisulfide reductase [Euryarchaeota archaeon RBG_19FT_COMBO_56_21]|nr:MAG: heterodisulfide reductase [Euryarchaeota archaeon RBG_19FT_COMBO_56_21]